MQSLYQNELKRLQRLTKDVIPDDKRTAIMPLMSNIAFLKVKLDQARVELMGESSLDSFIVGFRLGAKMIFDTFCSNDAPFESYLKD